VQESLSRDHAGDKYRNARKRDSGAHLGPVDFLAKCLIVEKSKTAAGTGRIIPVNPRAVVALTHWRGVFPVALPEHYVFPHEKYGLAGNQRQRCAYEIIPTEPMHRWKVGWESARKIANVSCRFHDLRHTFISRLAESQASDSTVMALAGHVSRAMMERCSHIRMEAKRKAVDTLSGADFVPGVAQNWAQFFGVNPSVETVWNWHTCSSMIFPSQTSSSPSG
jgi:integrase